MVRSQKVRAASHSDGSRSRIENASALAPTNAAAKRSTRRSSKTGYVAHSGATSSAPNFAHPASATDAPRAQSDVTSQNPKSRNAGMIASFVFAFSVYAVNGYAAHANPSSTASLRPSNRSPMSTSATTASRSNAIDVAWAAGSESHFPLHGK